jgi:hypothetical protein
MNSSSSAISMAFTPLSNIAYNYKDNCSVQEEQKKKLTQTGDNFNYTTSSSVSQRIKSMRTQNVRNAATAVVAAL